MSSLPALQPEFEADPGVMAGTERLRGLKVAFLAGTLGQGGAERQLVYMLRTLVEHGAVVRVLCLTRGEHYEQAIRDLGVEVRWIGQSPRRLGRLFRLVRELRTWRPDVLQSQHFHTNVYTAVAGRLLGIRHLGAMRSTGRNEVEMTGRRLGLWCLRWPAAIAANSEIAIQYAVEQGVPAGRLHHLANVLDTEAFHPVDRPSRVPVRIVAVGRLGPEKRFDRFLRAIAAVRGASSMPIQGVIVGAGPLKRELEKGVADLALEGCVEFAGPVSDMMRIYQSAEILMLTSDWEGTPNVLLEAMATGLPVLATRVGGVPSVVREGVNGLLADVQDEPALAARLRELVEQPELRRRLGAEGIRFVEAGYSLRSLGRSLARVYEKVLS